MRKIEFKSPIKLEKNFATARIKYCQIVQRIYALYYDNTIDPFCQSLFCYSLERLNLKISLDIVWSSD